MKSQHLFLLPLILLFFLYAQVSAQLGADGTASGTVLLPHGGELPPISPYYSLRALKIPLTPSSPNNNTMPVRQIQRLLFSLILLMMALSQVSAQILGADGTASGTVLLPHGGELPPMSAFYNSYNNYPSPYGSYGFFG
ncbi:unnamed protein product [Bursaphelenchus xylophilus]|uniref:(pine wood nematode) hypothetical protein n=1 Tax=Bursaphelenchus xylophilus TaxID=6326 RepID=A0A7I8XCQ2_BURXY|nr:unnamed protein product [Bursaphelenchus xylophilus]CAG9131595.1 unnamed protein product [Bursaphelenchus xylophilus]